MSDIFICRCVHAHKQIYFPRWSAQALTGHGKGKCWACDLEGVSGLCRSSGAHPLLLARGFRAGSCQHLWCGALQLGVVPEIWGRVHGGCCRWCKWLLLRGGCHVQRVGPQSDRGGQSGLCLHQLENMRGGGLSEPWGSHRAGLRASAGGGGLAAPTLCCWPWCRVATWYKVLLGKPRRVQGCKQK